MPNTGHVICGTGSDRDSPTAGDQGWVVPSRITANDGTITDCSDSQGSFYLMAYNFGFGIPAGATILGVETKHEMAEAAGGTITARVNLQDTTSTLIGSQKTSVVNGTTFVTHTYGGPADLWGLSAGVLTPTIVNATGFGVVTFFIGATILRVDYVSMAIEYSVPAASGRLIHGSLINYAKLISGRLVP